MKEEKWIRLSHTWLPRPMTREEGEKWLARKRPVLVKVSKKPSIPRVKAA